MSRMSLFNSPFLLGFDEVERVLEAISKSANESYPPYNIEHRAEGAIRITLALAGFRRADLAVSVEGKQLIIRGKQPDTPDSAFLYRGIATRQFQRKFVLAEGMEVSLASLANGLLSIDLERPLPGDEIKVIEITEMSA